MAEYSSDSSEEGSLTSLSSSELSEISSSSEADDSDEDVAKVRSQRVSASRRPQSKSSKNPKLRKKTTDKRTTVKALTRDEMEQLSSWFFSVSQAKIVERELREKLLISPRIRAQCRFASSFSFNTSLTDLPSGAFSSFEVTQVSSDGFETFPYLLYDKFTVSSVRFMTSGLHKRV